MNYANDYAYSKETQKKFLTTPKKLKRSYWPLQKNSKEVIAHSKETQKKLLATPKKVIAHSKKTQKKSLLTPKKLKRDHAYSFLQRNYSNY